jgi:ubiquinone/menaquinone biosynthesis C-methylase UbiE
MTSSSKEQSRTAQRHSLEAALKTNTGVRELSLIPPRNGHGEKWTGYVVPQDAELESLFGSAEEDTKRVHRWRKTYDLTQLAKDAKTATPGFNTLGWNSAYTRQPIPAEHMREWVELTVQKISGLSPSRVLEIGCGTGMLLLRLAPQCRSYVAMDFAPAVLQRVREQMSALGGAWDGVTLLERAADNFEGFEDESFDTVIINSVTQHFPNRAYLLRVLESATRVVRPGGRLFVGDNRSYPLLEPFALSVELFQAAPEMTAGEIRERVRRRVLQEDQLVLSPAFFTAARKLIPGIGRVTLEPKQGRLDTEMNRYRFDAILYREAAPQKTLNVSWNDWKGGGFSLEGLGERMRSEKPEALGLRAIPNGRLVNDRATMELLKAAPEDMTVEKIRASLKEGKRGGIDPSDLTRLAGKSGYRAEVSWAASRPDGSFDAVLYQDEPGDPAPVAIGWPQPESPADDISRLTNAPGKAVRREQLLQQLLELCREKFSDASMDLELYIVDEIPG